MPSPLPSAFHCGRAASPDPRCLAQLAYLLLLVANGHHRPPPSSPFLFPFPLHSTHASELERHKRCAVEAHTQHALDSLRRRELSIDNSVSPGLDHLDSLAASGGAGARGSPPSDDDADIAESLRALCARMGSAAFFGSVVTRARCKEADALHAEMPPALKCCVDPTKFVMGAVPNVFPVDRREVKDPMRPGLGVRAHPGGGDVDASRPGDRGGAALGAASRAEARRA